MSQQADSEMSSSGTLPSPNQVIIPVDNDLSDGDEKFRPEKGTKWDYQEIPDIKWRVTLAELWMASNGNDPAGKEYILDKLPAGYCLFDRARGTDPKFRDKFLYGHPGGFVYQSPKTFFPHLRWLMTARSTPCDCVNCLRVAKGRVPQKRRTKAEMKAFRASEATMDNKETMQLRRPCDSKGNEIESEWDDNWPLTREGPDYWKIHIKKMKDQGTIDEEIKHSYNMDWAFSHESMENYFNRLSLDPAFLPRKGELVLWVFSLDGKLEYNKENDRWEVRGEDGTWKGMPEWRAGVITQTPEEKLSYLDIVETTEKKNPSVVYHGFRVETLSDPIGPDKSYSSQFKYVPLKCIKPFNAWERYVHGRPREAWHPSIEFALTVMASWGTVSYTRFVGAWPDARIHARGLWVGAELIAPKDTIRLIPPGVGFEDTARDGQILCPETDPVDVMTVHKIALDLTGCQEDPKDPQLANEYKVLISGKVYTRDKNRLDRPMTFSREPLEELTRHEADSAFHQVYMGCYGPWYRVSAGRICIINQTQILGRCYEPSPNDFFFNTQRLDYDLHYVLNARRYSSQVDNRIPPGIGWFWGDSRAQILGLAEVNGIEVGPAADQRETPEKWQAFLKIRNGRPYTQEDWDLAGLPDTNGKKSKATQFKGLCKTSTMVKSGLGAQSSDDDDDDDNSEKGLSEAELRRPIPYREEEPDDEDEEEEEFDEKAANALL